MNTSFSPIDSKLFDAWLIDTTISQMYRVERGLNRRTAIRWWSEWNIDHRDCVCVLWPSDLDPPTHPIEPCWECDREPADELDPFDICLIDTTINQMYRVESGLNKGTAIRWWSEWNVGARDCVCVLWAATLEPPTAPIKPFGKRGRKLVPVG